MGRLPSRHAEVHAQTVGLQLFCSVKSVDPKQHEVAEVIMKIRFLDLLVCYIVGIWVIEKVRWVAGREFMFTQILWAPLKRS